MVSALLCVYLLSPQAPTWQWPISTEFGVTSSFGEYRGMRFHMGLDFSTGGVEGEVIRPAKAGTIYQIRATRRGYGRVLYVRHEGGFTTVYAHLAAFGPTVAKGIKALGKNPEGYFGRLETQIPVTQDTLIAHSGESGAGLPHLHFEVRDSKNRALDPLDLDFPSIPNLGKRVQFNFLKLIPRDASSLANGKNLPFSATAEKRRLQASGTFDLLVSGHIRGARSSRLGLRGIQVSWNGETIGQWLPRRIDYKRHRTAGAIFDQAHSGFGPTQFTHCFDDRQQTLQTPESLGLHTPLEVRNKGNLTIAMMDQRGTWHRFNFELDPQAPVTPDTWPQQIAATQATSLTLVGFRQQIQAIASGTDGVLSSEGFPALPLKSGVAHTLALEPGQPAQTWYWRTDQGRIARMIGTLPNAASFTYPLGPWRLQAKAAKPFMVQPVWLEPTSSRVQKTTIKTLSPMLRFGLEGRPAAGMTVSISLKDLAEPQEIGLYAFSANSKKWRWKQGGNQSMLRYELDSFQPLALARDLVAPTIQKPKIHHYFAGKRIVIPLRDQGSGIDAKSIWVKNKQGKQAFEFDPDRRWIVLPANAAGPWSVGLRDRAGHTTVKQSLSL